MPFIVQCPQAECRKFMLLEDSTRGTTVECLLCRKPIKVDASASGDKAPPPAAGQRPPPIASQPAPAGAAAAPTATPMKVLQCPHCKTPLRLPAGNIKAVKCPKCAQVFNV